MGEFFSLFAGYVISAISTSFVHANVNVLITR